MLGFNNMSVGTLILLVALCIVTITIAVKVVASRNQLTHINEQNDKCTKLKQAIESNDTDASRKAQLQAEYASQCIPKP